MNLVIVTIVAKYCLYIVPQQNHVFKEVIIISNEYYQSFT